MLKILLTSGDPDPSHLSSLTSHPSQTRTPCLSDPDLCVAAHVHAHTPCVFRPPCLGTACPLCLHGPLPTAALPRESPCSSAALKLAGTSCRQPCSGVL